MLLKRECRAVSRLLWDYTLQRLSEKAVDRVEIHISRCAGCRQELKSIRTASGLVQAYREEKVPESRATWHALRAQLEHLQKTEPVPPAPQLQRERRGTVLPVWAGTIAAGAVMAAVWSAFQPAPEVASVDSLIPQSYPGNGPVLSAPPGVTLEASVRTVESEEPQVEPSTASRFQPVSFQPVTPRVEQPPLRSADRPLMPRERPESVKPSAELKRKPAAKKGIPQSEAKEPVQRTHPEALFAQPQREFVMGSIPASGSRIVPVSSGGESEEAPVW